MKKCITCFYIAIVCLATGMICTVWIPSMQLTRKITVSNEVNSEQAFLEVGQGMLVRQAFVPEYDEIDTLQVCLDTFLLNKQNRNLSVSVLDRNESRIYSTKIPGRALKAYGWQEMVSRLALTKGEVYYLELKNEAETQGNIRFAVTEKGNICFEIVYREPLGQEGYIPYYLLVILLALILLVHILK